MTTHLQQKKRYIFFIKKEFDYFCNTQSASNRKHNTTMSKKTKKDEPIAPDQALGKAEAFVLKHKVAFIAGILAVIAIAGFNAFSKKTTEAPTNNEADLAIASIEATWQSMPLQTALDGFIEIIDTYDGSSAANKAHYYAGMIYAQQSNYDEAISHLSKYSGCDNLMAPTAKHTLGNCYSQIGDYDNAIRVILEAAELANNIAVTPVCWRDAAAMYESQGNKEDAMKLYNRIKNEYPHSPIANEAKIKLNIAK